jgi:hypothetical protein
MGKGRHFISIWFLIGVLLLIYGVIILGFGLYALTNPPEREVVMANLHTELWWGALLIVLGAVYSYYFRPGRE